jgi:hypothetical protein
MEEIYNSLSPDSSIENRIVRIDSHDFKIEEILPLVGCRVLLTGVAYSRDERRLNISFVPFRTAQQQVLDLLRKIAATNEKGDATC